MAELRKFEGIVLRRDPDGYGLVEFEEPGELDHSIGVFTGEVLQDPKIYKNCQVGRRVVGSTERRGDGFRIVRMEPVEI